MKSHPTRYLAPELPLDEILVAYLRRLASGQAPDPTAWVLHHPEWAAELAIFFEDFNWVQSRAAPLRMATTGARVNKAR